MHCYQYYSVGVVITFRCCDTLLSLASRSMCQYTPLIFNLGTRGTGADSAFGVSPYVMLVGLLLFSGFHTEGWERGEIPPPPS